jgi:hypothetical protein
MPASRLERDGWHSGATPGARSGPGAGDAAVMLADGAEYVTALGAYRGARRSLRLCSRIRRGAVSRPRRKSARPGPARYRRD